MELFVDSDRRGSHTIGKSNLSQVSVGKSNLSQVSIPTKISFSSLCVNPIQIYVGRNYYIGSPEKLPKQRNDATHAAELVDGIP